MRNNRFHPVLVAVFVLVLVSLACSSVAPAEPTATALPTQTSIPPTNTIVPTSTSIPSATPDIAATKQAEARQANLESYLSKGYITTTNGQYTEIADFQQEWAQINWYQWWPIDKKSYANLVFQGRFAWSTASSVPEDSGCGIIFGLQSNNNHYAVFIDKSRILFIMARGNTAYEVGKTKGSGHLNLTDPGEADIAVIVKDQKAYVGVNGDFTDYTLSMDQTSAGLFALTLLSGTNKDYGTKCTITNAVLWTPQK